MAERAHNCLQQLNKLAANRLERHGGIGDHGREGAKFHLKAMHFEELLR